MWELELFDIAWANLQFIVQREVVVVLGGRYINPVSD
jgi:hypothetical protein